jgi:hypothetical protein
MSGALLQMPCELLLMLDATRYLRQMHLVRSLQKAPEADMPVGAKDMKHGLLLPKALSAQLWTCHPLRTQHQLGDPPNRHQCTYGLLQMLL